tara:strand:- start:125 stop:424 length:300 start_codon:yes stop_codon:yes gene_type:complete
MNIIIFFIVSIACIIFLVLPYFKKNSENIINSDNLTELRKQRVLLELNNELENGTITADQFEELKKELFEIESTEKNKITELNLDNVEKIIKLKKNSND